MKQYIVDAFTDQVFGGNPAAICVLKEWPKEELMINITLENNLSETAFTVKNGNHYDLRWFTPGGEINLCGHATLATAFVLMNYEEVGPSEVHFQTLSGELIVKKDNDLYTMDFPAYHLKPVPVTQAMTDAIGFTPLEAWIDRDLVCVLESEEQVLAAKPNLKEVEKLNGLILHITAKGNRYASVSRSFAPKMAVEEDPVCGSGHCHLVPLWTEKLGKDKVVCYQASSRGGVLYCSKEGHRIHIAGHAVLYSISELFVDNL